MAETVNIKYPKRVIFPKNEQRLFLLRVISKLAIPFSKLAKKLSVHPRTLNDWKRGKYSISLDGFRKICSIARIRQPQNITIKESFWYVKKGAKSGGLACFKKYGSIGGDPEYRKKKWHNWWNKEGKYKKIGCITGPLPIKTPPFSKNLAEFVGIMLGDGGISEKQITVSTNSIDDKIYGHFVKRLINKNFGVKPAIYFRKDSAAMDIVVSRKKLVDFCNKKLGLKIGNKLKQGLDIPKWIIGNDEFEKACIRGLVDTDGCIFTERHKIKNKIYGYKRINFVSMSPALRQSVFDILKRLDLCPKMRNNRSVQIENMDKIIEYFRVIGTSNPKHKKRFRMI
jgi:DNA-binding XRE family transcriptional regulator